MTWTCIISLVSILGGLISEELGWRFVFIIHLPFAFAGVVATFLFLPETQFQSRQDSLPLPHGDDQVEDKEGNGPSHQHDELPNQADETAQPELETRRTFVQQLAIYSGRFSQQNIFKLLLAPLWVLLNPAVIWVGGRPNAHSPLANERKS